MLSKVMGFITGDLGKSLVDNTFDVIKGRFPAKMSEEEEAALTRDLQVIANDLIIRTRELELEDRKADMEEKAEFNKRIKDLEGTASDLKTIPVIGAIVIFLRGAQRPAWGFATMWLDFKWLSSTSKFTDTQDLALLVINALVLTFLFGERAIQNVMPIILNWLDARRPKNPS